MDEIVEVLGIISFIVMIVVFFSGFFMKHQRNLLYKTHRITGLIALAMMLCHGVLAMID